MTVETGGDVAAALLADVPGAYHAGVADVLVAALTLALCRWRGGAAEVLVDLEGHGREEHLVRTPGAALDISRTVGWFTTVYPVLLDVPDGSVPSALKSVKEQLRRVPNHGFGYGALRYLSAAGAELASGSAAPVLFNYLGRVVSGAGIDWLPTATGGSSDPAMPLGHALTVDVLAADTSDGPTLRTTLTWAGECSPPPRPTSSRGTGMPHCAISRRPRRTAGTPVRLPAGAAGAERHRSARRDRADDVGRPADHAAAGRHLLPQRLRTRRCIAHRAGPVRRAAGGGTERRGRRRRAAPRAAGRRRPARRVAGRAAPLSDGRVVQVISSRADVPMTVLDLSTDPDPTSTVDGCWPRTGCAASISNARRWCATPSSAWRRRSSCCCSPSTTSSPTAGPFR
ncbi:hypothetical protein GS944_03885 [Rhodococcus hoagii]|nr:hypothetical protein [Prescottella equi]